MKIIINFTVDTQTHSTNDGSRINIFHWQWLHAQNKRVKMKGGLRVKWNDDEATLCGLLERFKGIKPSRFICPIEHSFLIGSRHRIHIDKTDLLVLPFPSEIVPKPELHAVPVGPRLTQINEPEICRFRHAIFVSSVWDIAPSYQGHN